ncbi:hypothetical protein C8R47DRAFT_1229074 [Mycena vitilis]|nr:hypothetical protein C8R47DRAFT_1229074 [Mycena vitilis]
MQLTGSPGSTLAPPISIPVPTGETVLDALIDEFAVDLTAEQQAHYSMLRGMLSTGRSVLLSTTALAAGHRTAIADNSKAIERVRKSTEEKLQQLQQQVSAHEDQIEQTLIENIRILRSFGFTDDQLADLLRELRGPPARSSPKPELAPLSHEGSRSVTPLDDFQGELDGVLPPRGASETPDAFHRRGTSNLARRERTARSFAAGPDKPSFVAPPSASAAQFAKNTRFEDVGSISTAHQRPFREYSGAIGPHSAYENGSVYAGVASVAPMGSTFESFHHDQEIAIKRIAHREIGEPLNLPPHFKIPKTDPPPKYKGEDDLDVFMKFIELHCTWLRSQMLCGYDPAIDKYRITMLKSHLDGLALEWFILLLNETPRRDLSFTETLCALHQRFITTANAQRATHAFDAVKYDNVLGPDAFAEQLLKRAKLMNHIPDEFAINRRFLSGLPQGIRFRCNADRGVAIGGLCDFPLQ